MKGQGSRAFRALLVLAAVVSLIMLAPNSPQQAKKSHYLENIGVACAPTIGQIGSIGGVAETLAFARSDQTVNGMVQSTQTLAQIGAAQAPGQQIGSNDIVPFDALARRKALVVGMTTSHKQGIKPAEMRGVALSYAELAFGLKAEQGITPAADDRMDL